MLSFPIRKHAQRICRKCGLLPVLNSKPGRHLPYNHPQMEKVRSWVCHQISTGKYDGRLISNFDQVWSLQYRPRAKNLQQRPRVDELSRSTALKKIRHCIERVLNLDFTEPMQDKEMDNAEVHEPNVQGGCAAMGVVDGWRIPRTVTTVSWADGSLGRAFITCRSDALTEAQRTEANQVWRPDLVFI